MSDSWDPQVAKEIKQLEFDRRIELLTKSIVDRIKDETRVSKKKRHKQ